jgi:hypothetical protein
MRDVKTLAIETALTQEYASYSRSHRTQGKRITDAPEYAERELVLPLQAIKA